ncbi:hypothetical protein LTR93_011510 [Exophiala xenobiotica]|nr:hypothetical protein LTR93_011510 [Exophiala xenobiotica]
MTLQFGMSVLPHVPASPIVDFTFNNTQAPTARISQEPWKARIITELPWLSEEQLLIVKRGGRADKLLAIMQLAPCAITLPQGREGLHSLRLIVYAWINQPCSGANIDAIKWEAEPAIYDGPLTMRIKNGQVSEEGVAVEGRSLTWWVNEDGTGLCYFDACDASGRKRSWISFVLDDLKSNPKLVERLELEQTPWEPRFLRTKHGLVHMK